MSLAPGKFRASYGDSLVWDVFAYLDALVVDQLHLAFYDTPAIVNPRAHSPALDAKTSSYLFYVL